MTYKPFSTTSMEKKWQQNNDKLNAFQVIHNVANIEKKAQKTTLRLKGDND